MKHPIYAARTDTGRHRTHNEDHVGVDAGMGIAVLADGMGGHNAGEVASHLAVDMTLAILRQTGSVAARERLETALQAAHASIQEKAATASHLQGMGTTIVATLLDRKTLTYAHVGDSRLYRWCKGHLDPLTRDHSLLQEFIDQGHYTPDEAREKVARNILTRALGLDGVLRIDVATTDVHGKERYLLCSDGLYEMLDAADISDWLGRGLNADATCKALVEMANARGGRDNISVILIDIP